MGFPKMTSWGLSGCCAAANAPDVGQKLSVHGLSSSKDAGWDTKAASGGHSSLCLDLLKRGKVNINITAILVRHDRICSCCFFLNVHLYSWTFLYFMFFSFLWWNAKDPNKVQIHSCALQVLAGLWWWTVYFPCLTFAMLVACIFPSILAL